ncbi:hypothetical protein KAJ41_00090 [Candidatus Parcubacteria bacterium]|nr:hypothetical protein [Candidatus Parcubacteria bacterium]
MEQNTQPTENSTEVQLDNEGEPINQDFKKSSNKRVIILILFVILLIVAGFAYSMFFNKEDDSQSLPEENVEVVKDEEIIEVVEIEIDKKLDTDQDGLPDYLEKILGTAELKKDTDGDSYGDFDEIKNGYNPLNSEKYSEEEWEAVKEIIKSKDLKFYEIIFVEKDEVEIQNVFKSYIKSFTSLDYEVLLNNITLKSRTELENMEGYEFELKQFEKANYTIFEKDKKYAIMMPEFREQEYENGTMIKMPNVYFEYEENKWKVDHMLVQVDTMSRAHFSPDEAESGFAVFMYERRNAKPLE